MSEKAPTTEPKITHQQLADQALELHKATGGAPIEMSDGTRKVKIGPWIPSEWRGALGDLLPQIIRMVSGTSSSAEPKN